MIYNIKGAEGYKALVLGIFIIFIALFVGYVIQDFSATSSTGVTNHSTVYNFVNNGISIPIPSGVSITSAWEWLQSITNLGLKTIIGVEPFPDSSTNYLHINGLDLYPDGKQFLLNGIDGLSQLPNVLQVPLLILVLVLMLYGIVKILPG